MVKNYPQLSLRVPPDVRSKLNALRYVCSAPQWRIITDAIDCYIQAQDPADRELIEKLAGSRSRPGLISAAAERTSR